MPRTRYLLAVLLLAATPTLALAAPDVTPPRAAPDAMPPRAAPDAMPPRAPDAMPPRPVIAAPATTPMAARSGNALALEAGGGRVVMLPGAAASVFAADPKVAEARPASATSLFIFGVAPGRTTIAALDAAGAPLAQYDVTVRPSAFGAIEAHAELSRLLPGTNLQVETRPNGMAVSGETATPAEAERAIAVVQAYAAPNQTVENRITVLGATQVNLRVRFIEVDRQITRNLGVNWSALGTLGSIGAFPALNISRSGAAASGVCTIGAGAARAVGIPLSTQCQGATADAVIDALAQDNLVTILAEPNLTALSGETASFLAGGEFPIPVGQQNGTISIEFKQYGVALAFVPTVLSSGHISLRVRPEVSQLSTQGAVQLAAGNATLQIPALTVRRADTTVELGSGQSFAIAGLLQSSRTDSATGLPGLGEIPVLGALMRSDSFQRNESELVIVVTPYVVRPNSDPKALRGPEGATAAPAGDLERVLLFRQYASTQPGAAPPPPVPGDVGFIIQ